MVPMTDHALQARDQAPVFSFPVSGACTVSSDSPQGQPYLLYFSP